jgi:hypothetical protein
MVAGQHRRHLGEIDRTYGGPLGYHLRHRLRAWFVEQQRQQR